MSEFEAKYVRRRRAVILLGCSSDWAAQAWSFSSLLTGEAGRFHWSADVHTSLPGFSPDTESFSGGDLARIKESNGTIRIFDPISRRLHTNLRREGQTRHTDKMHLFSHYSQPAPVPRDLFLRAGLLTDFQWIILSDENTGTELHTDPEFTTPWNTVLAGHKWWVMLPHDVSPDNFLCDPDCSHDTEDNKLGLDSWFSHVLPQIRNRWGAE